MHSINQPVLNFFGERLEIITDNADLLAPVIDDISTAIVQALLQDKKLLLCGTGMSTALSQYFAAILLNRFENERPGLPAIALDAGSITLSAISTDCGVEQIFSRQISALGQPGDILIIFAAAGHTENLAQAVQAAHGHTIKVILIGSSGNDAVSSLLSPDDIELTVNAHKPAHIHEIHMLIIHCLGELIDQQLFGSGE